MKDPEIKRRFVELRAQGVTYSKISEELNTSKQTLINWSKEMHLEISNHRTIELEALSERYHGLKKQRIELLGGQLERVRAELGGRDLSTLGTERLMEIFLKLIKILSEEQSTVAFQELSSALGVSNSMETLERWFA